MTTAIHSVAGTYLDEAGVAGWAVVYGFSIYQGFKSRSYGIPLVSICLNLTWELFFAFACPPDLGHQICFTGPELPIVRIWAVFDLVIFYQLLRYGRPQQTNPLLKHPVGFYGSIVAFLVIGWIGQTSYITSHRDISGDEMAWIGSLIMNVLFILAAFQQGGLIGFSLPAAWFKAVANACIAISLILMGMEPFKHEHGNQFAYFLFAGVFVTDCLYIIAFYWRRRQPNALTPP